jgi:hypothetical protein
MTKQENADQKSSMHLKFFEACSSCTGFGQSRTIGTAMNYVQVLESMNQKRKEPVALTSDLDSLEQFIPSKSLLPLACDLDSTGAFSPSMEEPLSQVDLTAMEDSSDSLSPVPITSSEDSFTEEQISTVPLTFSPAPMYFSDPLSLGPTQSDFFDPTLKKLVPVNLLEEEEEFPDLNSLDDLAQWLAVDCPSSN